jgi:hypothetical protein
MIKDKGGSDYKDFAFIEFFSVEDSTQVLEIAKQERVKIKGVPVFLSYSRFKRPEQYVRQPALLTNISTHSMRASLINRKASSQLMTKCSQSTNKTLKESL